MIGIEIAPASAPVLKLAKTLGELAITASAVSAEFGSGINYVSVQSLSVHPDVKGLVLLAMFVCGIAMLPKAYLFSLPPSRGSCRAPVRRMSGWRAVSACRRDF